MAEIDDTIKRIEKDIDESTGYERLHNIGRLRYAEYVRDHCDGVAPKRTETLGSLINKVFDKLDKQDKDERNKIQP